MNLLSAQTARARKSGASKWTLKQVQGDGGGRTTVTCHQNTTYQHKNRHPELVSGSIVQLPLPYRRQTQPNRQINPMRIGVINQIDFPSAVPVLQLLLPRNRGLHRAENFKMHQPANPIFGSMSRRHAAPMLRKPLQQVRGNADIKRSVKLARKYIYTRSFFVSHALESATKWTLKQVQGDVNFRKMFRLNSHSRAVTLNSFQGPSGNSKRTVRYPHD